MLNNSSLSEKLLDVFGEKYTRYVASDYNLPKFVFVNPYFDDQLNLVHNYKNSSYNFKNSLECFKESGYSEPSMFFRGLSELQNSIKTYINEQMKERNISKQTIQKTHPIQESPVKKKMPFYHDDNVGKYFYKIDIIKGCFNAIKKNTTVLEQYSDYKDLVYSFDDYHESILFYASTSPKVRNIIFGDLKHTGIEIYFEKFIIRNILKKLDEYDISVLTYNFEEIYVDFDKTNVETLKEILIEVGFQDIIRINQLWLEKWMSGYVVHQPFDLQFKCFSDRHFFSEYASYFDLPQKEAYSVFKFENDICKVIK